MNLGRVLRARPVNPLERGRPWLRRTRALCKFNSGKEQCEGPPELCSSAQRHDTMWPAGSYRDKVWRRAWLKRRRKRSVPWQDREVRSTLNHVKDWSWSEVFHAAAVITGGERSWISAAVSLSMTFIGPPHLGQRQRPGESAVEEACCSACGSCAEPSK